MVTRDSLDSVRLRSSHYRQLGSTYQPGLDEGQKPPVSTKSMPEQKYVPEIVDSIKNHRPIIGGPRRVASVKGAALDESSTRTQVQEWLRNKGFSDYVQSVFVECSAADVFRLSKEQIISYCGEEGHRLHSLFLVQKRRSNFNDTATEAQLKALLQIRKEHVDQNNEMAGEGVMAEPEEEVMIMLKKSPTPPPSMASSPGSSMKNEPPSATAVSGNGGPLKPPNPAPRRSIGKAGVKGLRSVGRKGDGDLVKAIRSYQ